MVGEGVQPWTGRPTGSGLGGNVLRPQSAVAGTPIADDLPAPEVGGDEVEDDEDGIPDVEAGDVEEFLDGGGDEVDDAPERDPEEHDGESSGVRGKRERLGAVFQGGLRLAATDPLVRILYAWTSRAAYHSITLETRSSGLEGTAVTAEEEPGETAEPCLEDLRRGHQGVPTPCIRRGGGQAASRVRGACGNPPTACQSAVPHAVCG